MEMIAVIDFETTGLWPDAGARATEIAVVRGRAGGIVDRYQSLMNAGVRIPPFIASLTRITDAMIRRAPPAAEVMRQAADFIGGPDGTPLFRSVLLLPQTVANDLLYHLLGSAD